MNKHAITRIFAQPVLMLAAAGLVIVEGEKSAGIFAQFFVFNLISGSLFAVVGAIGLLVLFVSFMHQPTRSSLIIHKVLNIFGALLIVLSLALFFYWLPWGAKFGSFTHILPLATLLLFTITATCFIVVNVAGLREQSKYSE